MKLPFRLPMLWVLALVLSVCALWHASSLRVEPFTQPTTHAVDMPLTTTTSCRNFCGPTGVCAITGEQCFADTDCSGCRPPAPSPAKKTADDFPGNNSAGKLTVNVTPAYSPLTSGFGTQETLVGSDQPPPQATFGVDTWGASFNEQQRLFNRRYMQPQSSDMPMYQPAYSLTGAFVATEPRPSNY